MPSVLLSAFSSSFLGSTWIDFLCALVLWDDRRPMYSFSSFGCAAEAAENTTNNGSSNENFILNMCCFLDLLLMCCGVLLLTLMTNMNLLSLSPPKINPTC